MMNTEAMNGNGTTQAPSLVQTLTFVTFDSVKLRSSMTLFDFVSPGDIYAEVLDVFFEGKRCRQTLELVKK